MSETKFDRFLKYSATLASYVIVFGICFYACAGVADRIAGSKKRSERQSTECSADQCVIEGYDTGHCPKNALNCSQ